MRGDAEAAIGRLGVENLSVVYQSSKGPTAALEGLSLDVDAGEFVAVLGPSGCGKSTLLRVASGLLAPSAGRVVLGGRTVDGPRRDVGLVFQQATLLPWKSVRQNVLVPIRALRLNPADYEAKADELLDLVGLKDFANHFPNELSGGMQQRVGIARSLIHDPALLLMDEPFAALDAMTREHMMLELQSLWQRAHKSVLFITHSIPESVFLADRVIVLSGRPGKVIKTVPIDLPRPRAIETMADPEFGRYCNELRRTFGERVGR